MRSNPGIPWAIVGWTATTGIASGLLKCGDRICIRNRRNNVQTAAYVVDQGGKGSPTGFDLDYAGVFKVLDPDNQNYIKGSMDIDWWKCNDGIVTPTPSPPPPPPPSPTPDVTPCVLPDGCTTAFITSAQWDQFFPNRNHPDCEYNNRWWHQHHAACLLMRPLPESEILEPTLLVCAWLHVRRHACCCCWHTQDASLFRHCIDLNT